MDTELKNRLKEIELKEVGLKESELQRNLCLPLCGTYKNI